MEKAGQASKLGLRLAEYPKRIHATLFDGPKPVSLARHDMMRTAFLAAIAIASIAVVKPAQAQTAASGFGAPGELIVSVDRLFGLQFSSAKTRPDPTPMNMNPDTTKVSNTSIALLWNTDTTKAGARTLPVYSTPQIGLDYGVASSFTVGAALGYMHNSSSQDQTNNTTNVTMSQDPP